MLTVYDQKLKRPVRTMTLMMWLNYGVSALLSLLLSFKEFPLERKVVILAMAAVALGIAFVTMYVRRGLRSGNQTAYFVAIILSCMQIPSLLFPLGIYSLTGLFSKEVRTKFLL